MSTKPVNGTSRRRPTVEVAVPAFLGVDTADWTDLPPAAYPLAVAERVILPRLEAGTDLIRRNAYTCKGCQGITVTYDRHPGITPEYIDHRRFDPNTRCPGVAHSAGYPADLPADWDPSHEWFRPSEDVLITLTDQAIGHVMAGGLLLRPIAMPDRVEA